jgi:hypothetical protein
MLTIEADLDEARATLSALAAGGIDINWVLQKLEDDGIAAFEKSSDDLYGSLGAMQNAHAHVQ